jgi:hypothetical protein
MLSLISTQRAINWIRPFVKNQPLDFANQEPALGMSNLLLQTLFGAPLKWRHNRKTFNFTTRPATPPAVKAECDYSVAIADFGYLETQWIESTAGEVFELASALSLPRATTKSTGRPTTIAAQYDDGQGNITFRLKQMPNAAYTVYGDYQGKAPVLRSIAQTLPVPDEFGYCFYWGFLTMAGMLVDDVRVDWFEKKFIGRVLSLQDGLDAQDINLFLGLWDRNVKTQLRAQAEVNAGAQGRMV